MLSCITILLCIIYYVWIYYLIVFYSIYFIWYVHEVQYVWLKMNETYVGKLVLYENALENRWKCVRSYISGSSIGILLFESTNLVVVNIHLLIVFAQ